MCDNVMQAIEIESLQISGQFILIVRSGITFTQLWDLCEMKMKWEFFSIYIIKWRTKCFFWSGFSEFVPEKMSGTIWNRIWKAKKKYYYSRIRISNITINQIQLEQRNKLYSSCKHKTFAQMGHKDCVCSICSIRKYCAATANN